MSSLCYLLKLHQIFYDLFFFLAALAARFSFKFSTGSFFAEFFEGDFSFAIVSVNYRLRNKCSESNHMKFKNFQC